MRPADSNAVQYQPEDPPADPSQLRVYLIREFAKMKVALDAVAAGYDPIVYAEPAKPREGMRRFADGVQWNPGLGKGLYLYSGTAWVKL